MGQHLEKIKCYLKNTKFKKILSIILDVLEILKYCVMEAICNALRGQHKYSTHQEVDMPRGAAQR